MPRTEDGAHYFILRVATDIKKVLINCVKKWQGSGFCEALCLELNQTASISFDSFQKATQYTKHFAQV